MQIQDLYTITFQALQDLWIGLVNFIPLLIVSTIVLIIGWFIAAGIGMIITRILEGLKFNQLFETEGWKDALEKAELKVNVSEFIGAIFKWVVFIVALSIAVEILGLKQFAILLQQILAYLPNVIVAALIFVVAVIIADILEKIVRAGVEGAKTGYGHLAGAIVKWSIWIFAILMILLQLKVAEDLIRILFGGLVAMIAIAGGIAFGLGGKESASDLLKGLRQKILG